MKRLLIIALCGAISSCALPLNYDLARDAHALSRDSDKPELAILEYRLARHFSREVRVPTTCVALGRNTSRIPLPEMNEARLMARFPSLAPFDRCERTGSEYRDAATGQPAMMFDVHELMCETPTLCTAWSGFEQDERANGWSFYELKFDRYWHIRRKSLNIILTSRAPQNPEAG